jgi:predicted transporter
MTLNTIIGTSVVVVILIIALYIWAGISLSRKWGSLTSLGKYLYIALALLCPLVGPVPILILLHLDVGVNRYHRDSW